MLKMDDVQGRVSTPGALLPKGKADKGKVRPALHAPVVDILVLPKTPPQRRAALSGRGHIVATRATRRAEGQNGL